MMNKGDIVLFRPTKAAITKGSDGLARMVKQYDSPCIVYQVVGYWAYLYRLMDGGIHVVPMSEHWHCIDIDLSSHESQLDIVTHLLEVGVG